MNQVGVPFFPPKTSIHRGKGSSFHSPTTAVGLAHVLPLIGRAVTEDWRPSVTWKSLIRMCLL